LPAYAERIASSTSAPVFGAACDVRRLVVNSSADTASEKQRLTKRVM
jgi:hypothetical protein